MKRRLTLLGLLLAGSGSAAAAEVCDLPPRYGLNSAAVAIVQAACNEHRGWQQPFIDAEGRIASLSITEAERSPLSYSGAMAWQRVAAYWRESGTLDSVIDRPGARSCLAPEGSRYSEVDCRAFLIDTPWSAAFVSWVMTRAGLAGFRASARHIDYIRAAYRGDEGDPYQYADPAMEKPAPGDLLCLLRGRDRVLGHAGLSAALASGAALDWPSHCDIVIAANVGGDRLLYLIGGNVFNTVMMRKMPLDRAGRLRLPTPSEQQAGDSGDGFGMALGCSPSREDACDYNRRDWAALLKLRPNALRVAPPQALPTATPATPAAPMPPGFPRVVPPRPGTPPSGTPQPSPQPQRDPSTPTPPRTEPVPRSEEGR